MKVYISWKLDIDLQFQWLILGMCGMEVSQRRNDAIAGTSFNLQDGNCNTEFIEVDGNKRCGTGLAGTLSCKSE